MPISDRRRQQVDEARARARARARQWVKAYLRAHPCVDCGEADVRVLEFDHRDPLSKVANISRLTTGGCSVTMIEREVAKCDVRCANCHRRRTMQENHAQVRRCGTSVGPAPLQ